MHSKLNTNDADASQRIVPLLKFDHVISTSGDLARILVEPLNVGLVRFLLQKDRLNQRRLRSRSSALNLNDSLFAGLYLSFKFTFLAHYFRPFLSIRRGQKRPHKRSISVISQTPKTSIFQYLVALEVKGCDDLICLIVTFVQVRIYVL